MEDTYIDVDCIGDLIRYLQQFDPEGEVWLGDRHGITNLATNAWALNRGDVLIECNGEFKTEEA